MLYRSFRIPAKDLVLFREAATKEEISQSEFFRKAIYERAKRVLMVEEIERDGHQ